MQPLSPRVARSGTASIGIFSRVLVSRVPPQISFHIRTYLQIYHHFGTSTRIILTLGQATALWHSSHVQVGLVRLQPGCRHPSGPIYATRAYANNYAPHIHVAHQHWQGTGTQGLHRGAAAPAQEAAPTRGQRCSECAQRRRWRGISCASQCPRCRLVGCQQVSLPVDGPRSSAAREAGPSQRTHFAHRQSLQEYSSQLVTCSARKSRFG